MCVFIYGQRERMVFWKTTHKKAWFWCWGVVPWLCGMRSLDDRCGAPVIVEGWVFGVCEMSVAQ